MKAIRQAVILVGGKGTRLGELTRATPKPMLKIAGETPFLDYLLEWVARHGYQDIVLLAGYLGDQFESAYQGRAFGDARVRVLREEQPLGTGGALTVARGELDPMFAMMNGDALFDFNLRALEQTARESGAIATLALRAVADVSRYGSVRHEDGKITAFLEKDPTRKGPGLISGGVYILRREALDLIDALPCSLETQVFPELVARGKIFGREFGGYFLDVGLPETLEQGHRELPLTRKRPAAFLDRDGVINFDSGYTHKPEDLRFIPGAPEAIRRLNDLGYYVFVVTNQAGVARGFYGLEEVARFNREIQDRLATYGAYIDRFYVAPYHPEGSVPEFAIEHEDRKPNPGMLLKAMADFPVVREASFLIGDKDSDLEAARRAGVAAHLFDHADLAQFLDSALRH
jgi:D-glycero-D-manno-heptose 1,7-bisphosphate phosphatase